MRNIKAQGKMNFPVKYSFIRAGTPLHPPVEGNINCLPAGGESARFLLFL
jgi:hypothetical protein